MLNILSMLLLQNGVLNYLLDCLLLWILELVFSVQIDKGYYPHLVDHTPIILWRATLRARFNFNTDYKLEEALVSTL
jgi:hypothetical protein